MLHVGATGTNTHTMSGNKFAYSELFTFSSSEKLCNSFFNITGFCYFVDFSVI
jgi:hypothetical protein